MALRSGAHEGLMCPLEKGVGGIEEINKSSSDDQPSPGICESKYVEDAKAARSVRVWGSAPIKINRHSLFLSFFDFMRIDILTVVPELLESPLGYSIVGRARKKGLVEIYVHNVRKYGIGPRKTVDDYCYGGDAGMVMMVEPVFKMIEELKSEREYDEIIFMSPDGEQLTQGISNELSLKENIIILCGHYKGVDERVREHLITREISVGDYVVSGGEIPAALLADSIVRLIPGALTDETSALSDSFQDGLVSPPVYTRPAEFNGWKVPDVLLSGNPRLIQDWQIQQALDRTKKLRPGLLDEKK